MIRKIENRDREIFIKMVKEFFDCEAVLHTIPLRNIEKTFTEVISGSPYAKAYIIEDNDETAGYGLISLTYSNEAGGMVVWIEELYILDKFRGIGLGKEFLDFIYREFAGKAKRIRLELVKGNKSAARLYRHKGYQPFEYLQMVREIGDSAPDNQNINRIH
jgi:GNAT superfamily N-acetyltransferase